MSGRESFGPSPASGMPNMQLAFSADGTTVYKPVMGSSPTPTYQAASGGGSDGSGVTAVQPPIHNVNIGKLAKRKRGRPRKYGPDGTGALALTSLPQQQQPGGSSSPTAAAAARSSSPSSAKKSRGRPPGSGRKQQMAALGSAGVGFMPHVITVKVGEDVASKIMSVSQNSPRAVCILSANGAISNVTLRQAATSGGTVTYEGRFEILSLSGSFLLSESGGQRGRTGGLSVSLAGPDGCVLGGGVAGPLTAACPIQVVVGSFIAEGRKEPKSGNFSEPFCAPLKVIPGASAGGSAPSHVEP